MSVGQSEMILTSLNSRPARRNGLPITDYFLDACQDVCMRRDMTGLVQYLIHPIIDKNTPFVNGIRVTAF